MSFQEELENGGHLLSIAYKAGMEENRDFTDDQTILETDLRKICLALKDYVYSDTNDMYLSAKIYHGFALLFSRKVELVKDLTDKAVAEIFDTKKNRLKKKPTTEHEDVFNKSVNELLRLELIDLDDVPRDTSKPRLDEEPVVPAATALLDTAQVQTKIVKFTDQDIETIEAELEEIAKTMPHIFDDIQNVSRESLVKIPESSIQPCPPQDIVNIEVQPPTVVSAQIPSPEIRITDDTQQQLLVVPPTGTDPQQTEIRTRPPQHFIQRTERKRRSQNRIIDVPFYDFRESIVVEDFQGLDTAAVEFVRQLISRESRQTILSSFSLDRLSTSQDTRRLSSRPPSSVDVPERRLIPMEEEPELPFVEEQIEIQPVQNIQSEVMEQPVEDIEELPRTEQEIADQRQQRIMKIIRDWNLDRELKAEDFCMPPVNRLNMARIFYDLIALAKGLFVTLKPAPDSLELDTIEKGPKFDTFTFV